MKITFSLLLSFFIVACSNSTPKTEVPAAKTEPAAKHVDANKHVDFYSMQNEWPGACQHGTAADERQSPIALTDSLFAGTKPEAMTATYKASDAEIIDNGHTLVVKFKGDAGQINLEGNSYALKQFHFHKTSEHTLNGKLYDMEVHFVHMTADKNVKALALGFLVEKGTAPAAWKKFWDLIPQHSGPEEEHSEKVVATISGLDVRELIPVKSTYLTYEGSLTTPPCDEIVTHVVAKKAITFPQTVIEKFAGYHEISNRAIQPLGDPAIRKYRVVQEK